MSRTKNDGWVRIFEIPCLERHEKGYTVYKITSRVFPCQCPEASTQVTVWKRFSEFKKLHAEMSSLHAALYLKGTFPPLSKTSYFNRFETAILEERRAAIRATLEFVAAHPPLFTSAPFSRFFEDGDCRTVSEIDRLPPALSPQPSLTDSDISSSAAAPADGDVTPASVADSDARAAPAADVGVRVLDPLLPEAASGAAGGPSNLQLLSEPVQPDLLSHLKKVPSPPSDAPSLDTLSDCGDGALPDLSDDDERPQLSTDLSRLRLDFGAPSAASAVAGAGAQAPAGQPQTPPEPEIPELELPEVPDTPPSPPRHRGFGGPPSPPPPPGGGDGGRPATGGVNGGVGALPYPPAVPPAVPPASSQPKQPGQGSGTSLPYPPRGVAGTPTLPPSVPPSPSPSQRESGDALPYPPASPGATPSQPDPGHYLLTAADAICRAQEAESQCLWSLALSHYKDGIGTLINGVQGDPNAERQEAVKRKTALYIGRAEQLAALCRDTPEQPRRRRLSGLCVEGGRQQLARYQVVGLAAAGRHLIVTDRRLGDGRRYLIKVVVKCACAPESARAAAVLPERVSHMVQLHRLVETDTAYYLVLQYLAHGPLLDSLTAPRPPAQPAATDTTAPPPPVPPADTGPQPPAQPPEPRTQPPSQPSEAPVEPTTRTSVESSTAEPSTQPSRTPDPLSDPSEPPADPPEPGEGADVMSSSYLQLFADLAASSRRSGSVSLARNLSCPEPEPEPDTTERLQTEPAERPESDTEWERVDLDRDGSVSPAPTFAAADDGSPDLLLTRSQQLLSAVERTLQDSSRRQREPLQPPPASPLRPASPQAPAPPAPAPTLALAPSEAVGDANAPNSAGDSRRDSVPTPTAPAAAARRRPTLDEDWWSRGGGDEAGPPPPPPPPPAPVEREPAAGVVTRPSEAQLQLWTAQLVTALEQLHRQGVICGELRPDNVLLSPSGGACLTYFCRLPAASARPPATHRRRYRPPELSVPGTSPSPAADWWCLGALLWELHGEGPLWRRHPAGPADHTALQLPAAAAPEARALITALLRADPRRRPDALYIRRHAFFDGLDWNRI